jgi:hypothetical protein
MYKVLSAESCSGGDTQPAAAAAAACSQLINPPSEKTRLLQRVFYIQ